MHEQKWNFMKDSCLVWFLLIRNYDKQRNLLFLPCCEVLFFNKSLQLCFLFLYLIIIFTGRCVYIIEKSHPPLLPIVSMKITCRICKFVIGITSAMIITFKMNRKQHIFIFLMYICIKKCRRTCQIWTFNFHGIFIHLLQLSGFVWI